MLETYCLDGILISIFIFSLLLAFSICNKSKYTNTNRPSIFTHTIILLFCVFAFWDQDYYGYIELLNAIDYRFPNEDQANHLEQLYVWIAYFVNGHYTLFRLCIWGLAYILFIKTLKNFNIYSKQSIALFIVYFLLMFSYARVSLGMTSLFYGVSLFLQSDKKRIINICLGLVMLVLSYNAHKSMFVVIAVLPLIFFRYNKYTVPIIAISAMLAAWSCADMLISEILISEISNDEYGEVIQASAINYITTETSKMGIVGKMQRLLQVITLILPTMYCFINNDVNKYISSNFKLRCLVNYSLLISLISLALGIIISFESPLFYRIIFMAYIPNIIIISTLFKNHILSISGYNKLFFIISLFPIIRLAYTLYCEIVS